MLTKKNVMTAAYINGVIFLVSEGAYLKNVQGALYVLIASFICLFVLAWLWLEARKRPIILEGVVVDQNGKPVNGLWIYAYRLHGSHTAPTTDSDCTRDQGNFSIKAPDAKDDIVLKFQLPKMSKQSYFAGKLRVYSASEKLRLTVYNE